MIHKVAITRNVLMCKTSDKKISHEKKTKTTNHQKEIGDFSTVGNDIIYFAKQFLTSLTVL